MEIWVIVWDAADYNSKDESLREIGLAHHDNDIEASLPAFVDEYTARKHMAELTYQSGMRVKKLELKGVQSAIPAHVLTEVIRSSSETHVKEIASLKEQVEDLQIVLGQTRRSHGGFVRKIKKMLGYKNWPDIQGDFLDGVATLLEQQFEKLEQKSDTSNLPPMELSIKERKPTKGEKPCPFHGVPYSEIPGYELGYGCPVCKAIGLYHLPVPANKKKSSKNRKAESKNEHSKNSK